MLGPLQIAQYYIWITGLAEIQILDTTFPFECYKLSRFSCFSLYALSIAKFCSSEECCKMLLFQKLELQLMQLK